MHTDVGTISSFVVTSDNIDPSLFYFTSVASDYKVTLYGSSKSSEYQDLVDGGLSHSLKIAATDTDGATSITI